MERRGFIGGTLAALAGVLGRSEAGVAAGLVEARPTAFPLLLLWHQGQVARVEDGGTWPAGWVEGWVAVPVAADGTMPRLGSWDGGYQFRYLLALGGGGDFGPELRRDGSELREVGEERALWTLKVLEEFGTVPGGDAREQLRTRRREEWERQRQRSEWVEETPQQRAARRRREHGSVGRATEERLEKQRRS